MMKKDEREPDCGDYMGQVNAEGQTALRPDTGSAIEDVPADTIARWHRIKPSHDLADIAGMETLKARLREEADSPAQCYFFYSLPDSGETYLIEAFVSELMKEGFRYIRLPGEDIRSRLSGTAEKMVQAAFGEAMDNEPCILFVDDIDDVCADRDNPETEEDKKQLTAAFLEAYSLLRSSGKRVVLLGATNHPGRVDTAMSDQVRWIPIPLPDAESMMTEKKPGGSDWEWRM